MKHVVQSIRRFSEGRIRSSHRRCGGTSSWLSAAVLCVFSGCFATPASRIERVLLQDVRSFQGAESVTQLVAKMRAINTDGCPNDFRAAYLAHIHAWDEMAAIEQQWQAHQQQGTSGAVLIESFVRGFLGDPFGKTTELIAEGNQLQLRYSAAQQSIKTTFDRVQEIAVLHGAQLPAVSR